MQKLERPLKILIQKIKRRNLKRTNKNNDSQVAYFFLYNKNKIMFKDKYTIFDPIEKKLLGPASFE